MESFGPLLTLMRQWWADARPRKDISGRFDRPRRPGDRGCREPVPESGARCDETGEESLREPESEGAARIGSGCFRG